jgi:uncharacterized protein
MKKVIAIFFVCLLLLPLFGLAESLGQGSQRVFDNAKLMDQSDIAKLEGLISLIRKQYAMDVVVLTSNDAPIDKSQAFADDFYDQNGFGQGSDHDGILILIDMSNRFMTISTTGLMIRYITDARLSTMTDTAYPYLADGQYGQAAYTALMQLSVYLGNGIPGNQYNLDENGNIDRYQVKTKAVTFGEAAIALLCGLLGGLILFLSVRRIYAMKGSAYKYDLNANTSVTITAATDVYLRTQVTRVPRASSSSGGGSGRSSTHSSSSGRIHGGGSGRRF